jgi:hypothetical protein
MTDKIPYSAVLGIEIELGVAARTFMDGDLGLAIQSRQQREIADLQAEYEDLKTKSERLPDIRLEINMRRRALQWLFEIIDAADIAFKNFEQSEVED